MIQETTHVFKNRSGFALVELIVSIGIFLIVVTIVSNTLINMLQQNRFSQQEELLYTNLDFILENIGRDARTGYGFYCDSTEGPYLQSVVKDCIIGGSRFALRSGVQSGQRVTYWLERNQLYRANFTDVETEMNAPQVKIEELKFFVVGSSLSDALQPRVTIYIKGSIQTGKTPNERATLTLQTTIAQRKLDI